MSGGGAPKPPDPIETAAAQSKVNKETIFENARVNQIGQTTPFGSTRWEGDIGEQNRHQITELNPELQSLFFGDTGLLGQIGDTVGQKLDFSGAPEIGGGVPGQNTASFSDGRFSGFGSGNNIAGRAFSSNDNYDAGRFGSRNNAGSRWMDQANNPDATTLTGRHNPAVSRFSSDGSGATSLSSGAAHGWGNDAARRGGGAMARQGGFDRGGMQRPNVLDINEGMQGRQMLKGGWGANESARQGGGAMARQGGHDNAGRGTILDANEGFQGRQMLNRSPRGGPGGMFGQGPGNVRPVNLEAMSDRTGPRTTFAGRGTSNTDGAFSSGRFSSGQTGARPESLASGEYRQHSLTRPEDFGDERASYEKAMFDRGMHLLRPEFDKQQSTLDRRLYQRGIAEGSQASNDQRQSFGDRRDRAYGDLALASVMAGGQEQSRLADMASRNRSQLFGEDRDLVGEGRGLMNDRFGMDLASSGENRAIIGEQFGRDLASFGANEQAKQNAFGRDLSSFGANEQAMQNAFGRDLSTFGAREQSLQNAFGRDLSSFGAREGSVQNAFGRDATSFGLNEQAIQNAFGRDATTFGLTENSFQNAFGRDLASSAENRAGVNEQFGRDLTSRQQAIAEMMAQRSQPINDLTSLLSGVAPGGVPGMPQFTQFTSSAPDIMGMTGSNYASQANMYGARMGAMGSIAGGLLGMFSDRRLKENIRPVGKLANGLTIYTFQYRHTGGPMQLGLMSDEVREIRPEAVSVDSSGFDVVNYDKATR